MVDNERDVMYRRPVNDPWVPLTPVSNPVDEVDGDAEALARRRGEALARRRVEYLMNERLRDHWVEHYRRGRMVRWRERRDKCFKVSLWVSIHNKLPINITYSPIILQAVVLVLILTYLGAVGWALTPDDIATRGAVAAAVAEFLK